MIKSKVMQALVIAMLCCGVSLSFGQNATKEQEGKLIAVLKSNAELKEKSDACMELGRIGTADAVPALAALLADEKLSHMARYGLEPINSPAVDDALRDALGKVKGLQLVGVIGSIGVRHDEKAVAALTGFLKDPDAVVVQAAARALGTIGTEDAGKTLQGMLAGAPAANQVSICEGLFRCAEALSAKGQNDKAIVIYDAVRAMQQVPHQVRTGALRGAILARQKDGLPLLMEAVRSADYGVAQAAARIAIEMKDGDVAKLIADELGKLPVDKQVLFSTVLGKRGDAAVLPALLGLAKAGDKAARVSAIKAVAEIGNAGAAATLIDLLKDQDADVAATAAASVAGLHGAEVDEAVLKMLDSPDMALKMKMVDMAGQRRITKAMPQLMKMMEDKDEAVRSAAIRSYGDLAGVAELPGLLERLVKNTNAGEISSLEKALGSVCGVADDANGCVPKLVEALSKAGPEAKPAILRTLRVAGGADALKAVHGAVADANKDVHTAAIRVISEWKTGDAIPVLLDLAKNSGEQVDKILSLRGYLGMATRKETSAGEKLAICKEAMPLIQREEEKRMLLGALGSIANPESLHLIMTYLDDAAVKREAVATVMAIAEKRAKKQHTAMAKDALEKVVKVATDNPAVVKRAEELLKQMGDEK